MQISYLAQAVGVLSLALSASAGLTPTRRAAKTFCTPSQSCWPTTADWNAFNATIGGKLIKVIPWGSPCYASGPTGYNKAECNKVSSNYLKGPVRAEQVGTMQADNWAGEL